MMRFDNAQLLSSRRGSALVLSLLAVTVVAAVGAAFLRVTLGTTQRQASEADTLRAFYLAEAGLAESFQAVRIGRTGQVGSEEEPAEHGDGLLWVDAVETTDGQVRLTSTALVGSGRSALALIVEPVEEPLGFFSDEDLVVDTVLLVDGFNSEEATYEEEVSSLVDLQAYAQWLVERTTKDVVLKALEGDEMVWMADTAGLENVDEEPELFSLWPDLLEAYRAGTLFPVARETDPVLGTGIVIDSDEAALSGGTDSTTSETDPSTNDPNAGSAEPVTSPADSGVHTGTGGLLSSNNDVRFETPSDIFGDVIPGPDGTVTGLEGVLVTGDIDPRANMVPLPPVEVPPVPMAGAVRHEGLLPMLVSPGTSGHERIEVAAGAELVLRGPATVVIGTLVLEPGALLTLDTRDGDVELYVTAGVDLQEGSVVTTTSDFPDEMMIQVGAIPNDADGSAPVQLEATSQFHGTIYAPETAVRIGSDFEVFGSVVARRLEIGPGARLHFDSARYDGSPIPRLVSWRIVELPAAVRARRGNPFGVLDVERGTLDALSEAHDLSTVHLTLQYRDQGNALRDYDGTEDLFDWSTVSEIVKLERNATRDQEAAPESIRTGVENALAGFPTLMNDKDLVDLLITMVPLSPEEWALIDAAGLASGQYNRLVGADDLAQQVP